jgi:hypothetical protein
MSEKCPSCRAVGSNGKTCQDLLRLLLARQSAADTAAYGLAVACYALQHFNQQSDLILDWATYYVSEAVESKRPLEETRQRVRSRSEPDRDPRSITSLRLTLVGIPWRVSVRDLEAMPVDSDAERILLWAGLIVEDIRANCRRGVRQPT